MRTRVKRLTGRCGLKNVRICMLIAAAALAVAACEQGEVTSPSRPDAGAEMPVETSAGNEPVAVDMAEVVATVDLEHGGVATFLDLGDGHVGIAERAPRQARFVALSMIQSRNATPLEVYLALRPRNTDVPELLLRDHQRAAQSRGATAHARVAAPPRPAASPLADPGYDSYACDSSGTQWIADWKDAFVGITKYREAAYRNFQPGNYYFYPGAAVYYGTNTNSITYLGACNGEDRTSLSMAVHRRNRNHVDHGHDLPGDHWVEIHYASIAPYEKYTFYSPIPAFYRGFIHHPADVDHYGIGAAWTLSPPIKAP